MSLVPVTPETPKLEREAGDLASRIRDYQVTTPEAYAESGELLKSIAGFLKRVADIFDPIDRAQIESRRVTIEQRKKLEAPAQDAKTVLGRRRAGYEEEVARLRRAAEEASRLERERLQREEDERVAAEHKRLQAEADQRALDEAAAAEAAGDTELAEKIIATPAVVEAPAPRPVFVPPVLVPALPKVAGVSGRDNWSAEVTDLAALVKAIAAGTQPISYVQANMTALNGVARALKDKMAVPGVRARNDRTTAAKV